jgi:hypothetical protein
VELQMMSIMKLTPKRKWRQWKKSHGRSWIGTKQ